MKSGFFSCTRQPSECKRKEISASREYFSCLLCWTQMRKNKIEIKCHSSLSIPYVICSHLSSASRRNTIDLRRPRTRAFFQPTSRTIDFSLQLKNSDHVITFFVALQFQKYRSCDAIFCYSPQREKHEMMLMVSKTG